MKSKGGRADNLPCSPPDLLPRILISLREKDDRLHRNPKLPCVCGIGQDLARHEGIAEEGNLKLFCLGRTMPEFQRPSPSTRTDSCLKDGSSAGKNREHGASWSSLDQFDCNRGRRKSEPPTGHGDACLSIGPTDQLPRPTLLIVESGVLQAPDRSGGLDPEIWQG